jgi:hypothetical protein
MEIGRTRTGRVVEYRAGQSAEEFMDEFMALSDGDKFDVYCMYQWLIVRARRKYGVLSEEYIWWLRRFRILSENMVEQVLEEERLKANAVTSYKMVQLGIEMVDYFWRDF